MPSRLLLRQRSTHYSERSCTCTSELVVEVEVAEVVEVVVLAVLVVQAVPGPVAAPRPAA